MRRRTFLAALAAAVAPVKAAPLVIRGGNLPCVSSPAPLFAIDWPSGALIGWSIGSALYGSSQKVRGPEQVQHRPVRDMARLSITGVSSSPRACESEARGLRGASVGGGAFLREG